MVMWTLRGVLPRRWKLSPESYDVGIHKRFAQTEGSITDINTELGPRREQAKQTKVEMTEIRKALAVAEAISSELIPDKRIYPHDRPNHPQGGC